MRCPSEALVESGAVDTPFIIPDGRVGGMSALACRAGFRWPFWFVIEELDIVPVRSPYVVSLTVEQRSELENLSRRATMPYRQVVRARIVLAAADGESNASIARRLMVCVDAVRVWRKRFCAHGIGGLVDQPRSGRPRIFPATAVAEVKALACELPARTGVPLARWSCPELAEQARLREIVEQVSASTVRRWLRADALKPWQHRSWIFPRDPYFALKAARALDLYAGVWEGEPLDENDFVLSADEKPGVQARRRIRANLPPGPHQPMRVEAEYARGGTLAYFAAYDVHRAHADRPLRANHRNRPVYPLGESSDGNRALRQCAPGVLGRG
jgi:transposase